MDDDVIDRTDSGYIELTRRLEAYADLRLSPGAAATTRMRTAVMNAAHRRSALMRADATFDAAGATSSARAAERSNAANTRTSWLRPAAAIFAGVFMLAILAGTAYGARAGGPLYAARVWIEMANLPANLVDRAEAEVSRLEERLNEAQQASTAGDVSGTEAALSAYSSIVVEAAKGSGGDPTATAALEVTVTRHVVVLTNMVDSVPQQARSAAEHAVTSSTMALDDLARAGKHTSDQSHPTGPAAGGDRSRGGDGADAGAGVDADDAIARDPALGDPADLDAATHDRIPSETPASPATTQRDKTAGAGHVERRPPTPKPTNVDDHVNVDEHAPAASQRPHAAQARP